MRKPLTHRCWNHLERVAAVRCPGCARYYCRECVTEHDGRMVCAGCLAAGSRDARGGGRWPGVMLRSLQTIMAIFAAWLVFYGAARAMLSTPASFHDGTLWLGEWWEGEDE